MAPERLRSLLDAHALSQSELADILGMSQSYICKLLAGKVNASHKVRSKLAAYFRIEEGLLFQPPEALPLVALEPGLLCPDCPLQPTPDDPQPRVLTVHRAGHPPHAVPLTSIKAHTQAMRQHTQRVRHLTTTALHRLGRTAGLLVLLAGGLT